MTLLPAKRLESAARLYRRGRNRVLWINGVLYGGSSLFVFLNVLDYFLDLLDKGKPFRSSDLMRIVAFFVLSAAAGYLYGRFTWRNLACTFSPDLKAAPDPVISPDPHNPVQ
jgi:hypothetical protein